MTAAPLAAVLLLSAVPASAEPPRAVAAPTRDDAAYERLDIGERRITEGPYEASLVLALDERGLRVRVGVALTAARIDVLLRNVKGTYLFRADFDAIRRGGAPPPQP